MTNWKFATISCGALVGALALLFAASDLSAQERTSRTQKKKTTEAKVQTKSNSKADDYAAVAHDQDPSGNYKGHPDWARATFGTRVFGK